MSRQSSTIGAGASAPSSRSAAFVGLRVTARAERPASTSKSMAPSAWTSVAAESSSPRRCSGAMYAGVPTPGWTAADESPKSRIRTASPSSTSTLDGFRSRCSTPWRWSAASPRAHCPKSERTRPHSPAAAARSATIFSDGPSTRSIVMKAFPPVTKSSCTTTRRGCTRSRTARNSAFSIGMRCGRGARSALSASRVPVVSSRTS